MVRRCAAFGRRNLLLDVCFFDSARMRASGRRNLLLELVQRFYEATSWRVLLSGKDVRKHNLLALRYVVAGGAAGAVPVRGEHPREHRVPARQT
jgi:hypothetical protein